MKLTCLIFAILVSGIAVDVSAKNNPKKPAPKHCDGVDLFPLLKGERTGQAHEYLFWLNNEPGDAVRWQDWRLYRKYEKDPWLLFDLKADPREETNLAAKHSDVVDQLAEKHAAWAKTLAPLAEIPETRAAAPIIPTGHGWATASSKSGGQ